jgi:uncharacterized protein (TIGR02453 family)
MGRSYEFSGFNRSGLQFLDELSKNNNKEWFENNKSVFKDILEPISKSFVNSLIILLEEQLNKTFKGKLFCIYRDVRFSKDKTPYNPHIRIAFSLPEKTTGPTFMLSLEANQTLIIGCVIWLYFRGQFFVKGFYSLQTQRALGTPG